MTATALTNVANGRNAGSKAELLAAYIELIAGLTKEYGAEDVFLLPGGKLTRDEVIAELQTFVDAAGVTRTCELAWHTAVESSRAAAGTVVPLRASLRSILAGRFGKDGSSLLGFGFIPERSATRRLADLVEAQAKSAATREARGTLGSVQKKSVRGDVVDVRITAVTATPPSPASTTST